MTQKGKFGAFPHIWRGPQIKKLFIYERAQQLMGLQIFLSFVLSILKYTKKYPPPYNNFFDKSQALVGYSRRLKDQKKAQGLVTILGGRGGG